MKIYLVGGAVRDQLLGRAVFDKDWVVVGATPQQLESQGFRLVGQEFPVFIHPTTGEEYALARTERKAGKGYKGFDYIASPDVTLEQDLIRRDLTINAIAQDDSGELYDYYGGLDDINAKVLRHVSPAFAEDPLRVLRVARFAARFDNLGFTLAPETCELMQSIAASGELAELTIERVWKETERALSEPSPWRYFEVLAQSQALPSLFPEFEPWVNDPALMAQFKQSCTALANSEQAAFNCFAVAIVLSVASLPSDQRLEAAQALCLRLKTPKAVQERVKIAIEGYPRCCSPQQLDSHDLLALLTATNCLRKPENIKHLLTLANALEASSLDYNEWWQKVAKQVANVNPAPFVSAGLKGAQIGTAIEEERLKRCQRAIDAL
ncbi:MAG: hypothetical protein ACPGMR_00230 [Pontibacterium sp.]